MKHLILIIVLLVCVGCNKFSDNIDSGYIEIIDAPDHEPAPVYEVSSFRIYKKDDQEHIEMLFEEEYSEHPMFLMFKELLCSTNPFAKELVEKYKITSDTIECPKPDNPDDYISMCEGIEDCMKMFPEKYAIKNPIYHDQSDPCIKGPGIPPCDD